LWRVAELDNNNNNNNNNKYVFGEGHISTHVESVPCTLAVSGGDWRLSAIHAVVHRFVRFLIAGGASGGAKFPKMADSLLWMLMNHRAKFDDASFILCGKICNCTNTQNYKKNSKRYIHIWPIGICG